MNRTQTTVLLLEDDDDARASLERSLKRAGHVVLSASSVDEAIQHIEGHNLLHAVVTDMVLGSEESGGIRFVQELRKRGNPAPVVIITAFADLKNVKQALNEGAAFLLEKPFRAQDLITTINRVADARPPMGSLVDQALNSAGLTEKEHSIARLVLKGLTSSEIAHIEHNSDKTVRQHITRIYQKCGVASRAEFFNHVFPW